MNTSSAQASRRNGYLFTIAASLLLLYLNYAYIYRQIQIGGLGDFPAHLYTLLPLFRTGEWWKGWMTAPHCLWHLTTLLFYQVFRLPLEAAACYATCVYVLLHYLTLIWCIQKITAYVGEKESLIRSNVIAFGFTFVQALYFYWLDAGSRYLGSFSMNPMHNPTQMCVRIFGILCFCLVVDLLGSISGETYRPIFFHVTPHRRRYNILLAVLLFLSVVMKPTFAEMFIPAVAFCMLGSLLLKLFQKKDDCGTYFKHCLTMLLCSVPALLYMLVQYLVFFFFGGSYGDEGGLVFTKWLEVWKLFTDNVYLSVLLGMAFPIYMIVIDPRFFFRSIMGRISLLGYGFGFLEAAVLGEAGDRLSHANFIWPLMSGMLILWFTALMRLLMLERAKSDNDRRQTIFVNIGWVLFALHVLCGFLFLAQR